MFAINKPFFSLLILLVGFLAGCAQTPATLGTVDFLLIENDSGSQVSNVKLSIPKLKGQVSCSIILPGSNCSLGFPERERQGNAAVLSWEQNGYRYQKELDQIPLAASTLEKPLQAILKIRGNGVLEAYFK